MEVDTDESIALNPPADEISEDSVSAKLAECERIVASGMLDMDSGDGHFESAGSSSIDSLSQDEGKVTAPATLRIKSDVPITDMLLKRLRKESTTGGTMTDMRASVPGVRRGKRGLTSPPSSYKHPLDVVKTDQKILVDSTNTPLFPAKRRLRPDQS